MRSNLGLLQYLIGDLESALENLKHDLSPRRRLYEEDVSSVMRNFGITFQLSTLASVNFMLGRLEETERLLSECLVHSRRLAKLDESNPTALSRHAFHLVQMAELMATRQQWEEAQRYAKKAVEKARYSFWMSPRNSVVMRPLVQSLAISSRLAYREGRNDEGKEMLNEANAIFADIHNLRVMPEHRAIKARLSLRRADPTEAAMLLKSLEAERKLDPYLKAWAKELELEY